MKRPCFTHIVAALFLAMSCASPLQAQRTEKYRPQYHFSPNSGWIGDPDGLVHYAGKYHLFWWGHAISSDMVHWTELPYPIIGDPGSYQVTTGSAVIDENNVSGFGTNSFINFHTLDNSGDQRIGLSTSTDSANNFTDFSLYGSNPILSPPSTPSEFRDPQIFWHAASSSWIMLVTRGRQRVIDFYRSTDLLHWTPSGSFGPDGGSSGDMWETPDLVQLPVDGSPTNTKWVLSLSIFPNHMGYFVGSFDGNTFTNLYPGQMLTTDFGMDFYAARTWRDYDTSSSRATLLGWMGNWNYSTIAPSRQTYGGAGAESIPRDLALKTYPEGIRLTQTPIPELQSLRQTAATVSNVTVNGTHPVTEFASFSPSQNSYELDATFTITSSAVFGFNLLVDSTHSHYLTVQYDPSSSTLTVDRTHSSDTTLNSSFPVSFSTSVSAVNNQLRLHIFIDQSSIEVFTNDGKQVLTALTYPGQSQPGIEVFSNSGNTTLASFSGWELTSIWSGQPTIKIQSGGIYEVQARHDGKVMDAPGFDNTTRLQQWDWLNGANQQWKVDMVESGYYDSSGNWVPAYYRFTNQNNNKVMDLRGSSTSNGSIVQQYDWVNGDNQKWQIEEIGGGYFKIISKATATDPSGQECVEVTSGSTTNGQPLQTWKFLGYHHQEWQFILLTPP